MMDNLLFTEQDIYTFTPLYFAGLIGVMWITGKWKRDIILMIFLILFAVSTSMFMYGYFKEVLYLLDITSFL